MDSQKDIKSDSKKDMRLNCLSLDCNGFTAVGNIVNKEGYQKVRICMKFLKEAMEKLEFSRMSEVVIYAKTDFPLQIGEENIGILIAPIHEDKRKSEIKEK